MSSTRAVTSNLGKLDIKGGQKQSAPKNSWEDSDSDDDDDGQRTPTKNPETPGPPPPTPASPSFSTFGAFSNTPLNNGGASFGYSSNTGRNDDPQSLDRRPEKSTAVASRLIAAGIGQKAPKRTKEEREYDAAMKKQELRRREQKREEEERKKADAAKARQSMWED